MRTTALCFTRCLIAFLLLGTVACSAENDNPAGGGSSGTGNSGIGGGGGTGAVSGTGGASGFTWVTGGTGGAGGVTGGAGGASGATGGSSGAVRNFLTQKGYHARTFIKQTDAGMVGINVGIPVPLSIFGFKGYKD